MPNYKLYYFNFRANGEATRLIFAAAGVKFDDVRISQEEWKTLQSQTPFGMLPVLEVDGKRLAQSRAINRYLSRKFGLAGKTELEAAEVDAIVDQYFDFLTEINPFILVVGGQKEGDKEQLYKDLVLPARDKFYGYMKKILANSKSGYLVGDGLTTADIEVSEMTTSMALTYPNWLTNFPELEKHAQKVIKQPGIAQWRASRPLTPY